jgi:hypothetical protein
MALPDDRLREAIQAERAASKDWIASSASPPRNDGSGD